MPKPKAAPKLQGAGGERGGSRCRSTWRLIEPLWHALMTAEEEEEEEVRIDPVQQALANYSIINVNPWEPEKPCAPAQLHNKLAPRSAAVQDYAS